MLRYGDIADFKAYHDARGQPVPGGDGGWSDASIEAALLVASEWLDARYGPSFSGYKSGLRDQIRQWPRIGAYDRDEQVIADGVIPVEVLNATYEAAFRQRTTPGSLSIDWTPGPYKRVAVSGAVSVEYAQFSAAQDVQSQFQIIDEIIAPLLTGTGAMSRLTGQVARV